MPRDDHETKKSASELIDKAADLAIDRYPNQTHDAAFEMANIIRRSPVLKEAMLERLLGQGCLTIIQRQLRQRNRDRWQEGLQASAYADYEASKGGDVHPEEAPPSPTAPDPSSRGDRLWRSALHGLRTDLMHYKLRSGLPLGLANKIALEDNAMMQERQASRMAQTVTWLRLIKDRLPNERTIVRDALTEADLVALQQQAVEKIKQVEGVLYDHRASE